MSKSSYWRMTMRVRVRRIDGVHEFKRSCDAIPGTRAQAARHFRKVCLSMWPSASLRLVRAIPDRQAEARHAS